MPKQRVQDYLDAIEEHGLDYDKLVEVLGVQRSTVYAKVRDLRLAGRLSKYEPNCFYKRLASKSMTSGDLNKKIRSSPEDVQLWLARNVPEGGTIADFAIALMIDAMDEENQPNA